MISNTEGGGGRNRKEGTGGVLRALDGPEAIEMEFI